MPREQINFPSDRKMVVESDGTSKEHEAGEDVDVPPGSTVVHEPTLHVNWLGIETGGLVQVSLEMDLQAVKSYVEMQEREYDGRDIRSGKKVLTWYTPVLTRHEINRLISTLRKARDRAYGKDA